ncbi:hypothetical protein [Argonema galeatum]|uniref:hypothetical protein n=1 Tax=Argonema galeatum TaxID=2942762 RepID=UPI002011820C|nr:hypothetical protein [Argonema galeatum]MCL1467187.1 hypothetical protein [Argonema galeatum A003/A1]
MMPCSYKNVHLEILLRNELRSSPLLTSTGQIFYTDGRILTDKLSATVDRTPYSTISPIAPQFYRS